MNLRQLEYFVALAEHGSFTRAAEACHVAQPSLSQQIRGLEAELGGELVARQTRGIALTEAGRAFLPEAKDAVNACNRAREAAQRTFQLFPDTVDIATVRTLAMQVLPQSIERWYREHPDFRIRLHEFSTAVHVEQAVDGSTRLIGLAPAPGDWDGPMRRLGWDGLVAILPADDPLPPGEPVALDDLRELGWVLFERAHGLRAVIDAACAQAGFEPRAIAETGQVETAIRLAASGLGVALAPPHTVPIELRPAIRPLRNPIVWEVAAYARAPWPAIVDEYLDTFAMGLVADPPDDALVLQPSDHPPAAA
ncbi:MAG TPA: LysR family transcriptional regulator [Conexibacter sp.]|nr:LysR family transcriptional regulator [Conexibacter sp.]